MDFSRRGWTFSQTPIWACCDPELSDKAFRLFAYLAWRQGTDTTCWPSLHTISRDLGCSENTTRRNLRQLETLGYLITQHREGRSNRYTLVADPPNARRHTPPTNGGGHVTTPPPPVGGGPPKNEGAPPPKMGGTPPKNGGHDDNHERKKTNTEKGTTWASFLALLAQSTTRTTFETVWARATPDHTDHRLTITLPNEAARIHATRAQKHLIAMARAVYQDPELTLQIQT